MLTVLHPCPACFWHCPPLGVPSPQPQPTGCLCPGAGPTQDPECPCHSTSSPRTCLPDSGEPLKGAKVMILLPAPSHHPSAQHGSVSPFPFAAPWTQVAVVTLVSPVSPGFPAAVPPLPRERLRQDEDRAADEEAGRGGGGCPGTRGAASAPAGTGVAGGLGSASALR